MRADPLNLTGIITVRERLRTAAGNRIVYRNGVPVAALEGDMLRTFDEIDPSIAADVAAAAAGRGSRAQRIRRPTRLVAYLRNTMLTEINLKKAKPQVRNGARALPWIESANISIIFRLKAGMSSGFRR